MFRKTKGPKKIEVARSSYETDKEKALKDFHSEAKTMRLYKFEANLDCAPYIWDSSLKIHNRRDKLYFVSDRLFPLFY